MILIQRQACIFWPKGFCANHELKYRRYPRDSKYIKAMEEDEAFFQKNCEKDECKCQEIVEAY